MSGIKLTPEMIDAAIKIAAYAYEFARDLARKKGATEAEWEARWIKAKSDHVMTLADHIAALGGAFPVLDPEPPPVEPPPPIDPTDPHPPPPPITRPYWGKVLFSAPLIKDYDPKIEKAWTGLALGQQAWTVTGLAAVMSYPSWEPFEFLEELPVIALPDEPPYVPPVEPPPVEPPVDPPPPTTIPPYRQPLGANPMVSNPWKFPNGCRVWEGLISGKTDWMVAPQGEGLVGWQGSKEIGIIGMG